jgi:epoxyqueuosine reductase
MDARRCISYLTIELKGSIPEEFRELAGRHVYGCDICQDVCPWNRAAPVGRVEEFQPRRIANGGEPVDDTESLFLPRLQWLASLSEEEFRKAFRGSAMKRAKWRGLVRNACIALGNSGATSGTTAHASTVEILERLSFSAEEVIAESAKWALSRIKS